MQSNSKMQTKGPRGRTEATQVTKRAGIAELVDGGANPTPCTLHDRSPGNLKGAVGQLYSVGCGCRSWQ